MKIGAFVAVTLFRRGGRFARNVKGDCVKMAMIDVGGGKYENLVTDDEFIDVIDRKISPEFARTIRQKITDENDAIEEMKSDMDYIAADSNAYFEAFQEIRNLARDARTKMKRLDKEEIIQMFDEIQNEAEQYL